MVQVNPPLFLYHSFTVNRKIMINEANRIQFLCKAPLRTIVGFFSLKFGIHGSYWHLVQKCRKIKKKIN